MELATQEQTTNEGEAGSRPFRGDTVHHNVNRLYQPNRIHVQDFIPNNKAYGKQ